MVDAKRFSNFPASGLTVLILCASLTPALAQTQSDRCSTAYHAALAQLRAVRGDDLGGAHAALRAADPVLPGRWIYAQSLFGKPGRKGRAANEPERVCAERTKVAGRFRCVRYAETPTDELPKELVIGASPSAEELRILKALNDLVEGRGAVPEVGPNGKYTWLTQRAAGDMKIYISQSPHVALCAGGAEVADFYAHSLRLIQKRIDDVAELGKRAREAALARIQETKVDALASREAGAGRPLVALVGDAVGLVVTAAELAEAVAEVTALAALQKVKPALIAAQVEAAKADEAAGEARAQSERVQAAARAVRMIEAAVYADIYAERYRKFSAAVLTMPGEIRAAHGRACTCWN